MRLKWAIFLTLLLVPAPFVVPAAALGQSAGDDQYVDPFQNSQGDRLGDEEGGGGGGGGGTTESQPTEPAPSPDPGATAVAPETQEAVPAQESEPTLPVTGLATAWLGLAGAAMMAAGLALRRRAKLD